ncbi:P-loop containing nucleoside triphosphate hydrolase protein [Diaporthe sp. PMI_573]|nr:P-loop containing nucleoside triphosphate hydrolase protein [Diaporthaceae sp. PMI_573]
MGCTVILCTHDVSLLPRADHIIVLGTDGRVSDSGTFPVLSTRSDYLQSLVIRKRAENGSGISKDESPSDGVEGKGAGPWVPSLEDSATEPPDDLTRQLGDASLYEYLAGHIGLWRVLVFVLITCGWAVFSTIGSIWLKDWSSADSSSNASNAYYLGVYAVFQGMALLFLALFSGFTLTTLAVKAGRSLHQVLLKAMVWAPLSFFSTVDIGITTNRFSQDIILIDGDMPMSLLETLSAGLVAVIQMIFIAVAAPYVAIAYPFLPACLYFVQSFYLRTSRQLRFLDLEARSPLYTQFLETIQGLATIRSFGWAGKAIEKNHDLVDASQRPVYLLYMVQRWLQLVLELIIAVTAILLVALMSLSQELKMIVINYTNLETSLTAISRIRSFEKETPTENLEHHTDPPPHWPQTGRIQLDAVTATYDLPGTTTEKAPILALKDVSLDIPSGQKVAICGRSGSGKSTLIAALTRMVDLCPGSGSHIRIDGLDTAHIQPSAVRAALNVIPQDPFFFYGSVARNIDPDGRHSAETLREVLEKCRVWEVVQAAGGVNAEVDLDCFSLGQKQLLALARAILRDGHIVLLDEATSSVDQHTADMIMKIVRDEFRGRTVIAVAHQLNTIVDFDVVVVMDSGRAVEVGNPRQLLESRSAFRDLWDVHSA